MLERTGVFLTLLAAILIGVGAGQARAREGDEVSFAILSDPHYYHKSLGTEGAAFEAYLAQDRKLLRESEAILDAAIEALLREKKVKFVLVPGDLTKDGERLNHFLFALKMKKLERAGIPVFVVPGNHDINNPHAVRFDGDREIRVPNVSPELFRFIYRSFGYGQALFRDRSSLSYVAEPVKGIWLIAMDACRYDTNEIDGKPATGGRFRPETLEWVLKKIAQGKRLGKQMIGMMHHGVLEHYAGQSRLFPEYVVENWGQVSRQLAAAGLSVVFTGHYHANDVTEMRFEGGSQLFDVETGSLVTWPNPYRIATLTQSGSLKLKTRYVEEIDYDTGDQEFPEYAEDFLTAGLTGIAYFMLTNPPYHLTPGEPAATYAGQLAEAFKAHYAGDERPTPPTLMVIQNYLSQNQDPIKNLVGQYLGTLWTDLTPQDNTVTIETGAARQAGGTLK